METEKLQQLIREGRRVKVSVELPKGDGTMETLSLTGQVTEATPRISQHDPDALSLEMIRVKEES